MDNKENKKLGQKIRQMRKAENMSLAVLADRIGKTSSYLSQVERGLAEPSITALREIAKALSVPMFYFLVDEKAHNAVVKKEQRKVLKFPDSRVRVELVSPDLSRQMEMIKAYLEPGASTSVDPLPHQGEECTLVLKGEMKIQIGEEYHHLEAGDSVYYIASIPHKITNTGDEELVFVSSITPPNF